MSLLNDIVIEFQHLHDKILDIYEQKLPNTQKWNKMATEMDNHNSVIVKLFKTISKEDSRVDINLDYAIKFTQLKKQIASELDIIVKVSLLINSLHYMIYDMLRKKGNYYFSLNGPNEMQALKKDITYYINVSIKNELNINFHAFILLYALESLFNSHFYVGIDFEYTNKMIQLAQLNFEHNVDLRSIIMIVSPNELTTDMMNNFINLIICNKFIRKILHGSDSLDIPYMYEHLLNQDPNKIIKFTRTLIDTRFLCEYYKLTRNQVSNNKCAIYDENKDGSAIYYFGVVSLEQQEKLAEILRSMPSPHDVTWNIFKMPRSQIYYAQYDVLFLKYLYYVIINKATQDESTDLGKKEVIELYKHVLNEITRFIYLENREVTFLLKKCKEEVDPANNYFIRKTNGILKLIDIFNSVSINIHTTNPKVSVDNLLKVNHYKKSILLIIKRMVYGLLSRRCRIMKDNSNIWSDKLDNQFIFDFLITIKFYYLERMFKQIEGILRDRIIESCK